MLSFARLPLRNSAYHWRSNLPLMLGVAVGAAVLAGALIVGDSLRGSLRERSLLRLNGVESAYVGPRLVREQLAEEVGPNVLPALILGGSARSEPEPGTERQLGRVTVVGLSPEGYKAFDLPEGLVLGTSVANHLQLKADGIIDLGLEKASAVPRGSLLGRRSLDDTTTTVRLKVGSVLPADHSMNQFTMMPDPNPPLNIFVPLTELQDRLERPGRVNALLATDGNTEELNKRLGQSLQLADWGLKLRVTDKEKPYFSVESDQLLIEPRLVRGIQAAADSLQWPNEPTYSYLANAITLGQKPIWNNEPGEESELIAYSTVAALDATAKEPLGPFLPEGVESLDFDEIVLVDWDESPFHNHDPPLKKGEQITVTFFKPEIESRLDETYEVFRFAGFIPLSGVANDKNLTPPFPGITDKTSISDWDSPFELNNRRIRPRDERYWEEYRATPKAYIHPEAGKRLWGSRFGETTSIRVAPPDGQDLQQSEAELARAILSQLDHRSAGLRFEPTRKNMLLASRGGTDFGVLLLAFSLFLIVSALLLVSLLFRLAIDRRGKEVGLLLATGYSQRQVRRLLMAEALTVAAVGALIGLLGAVGYAELMIWVLTELWPTEDVGQFLRMHLTPGSLIIGFLATMIVAGITIRLSLRGLRKVTPPALLRGETREPEGAYRSRSQSALSRLIPILAAVTGGVLLYKGGDQTNADFRAMSFFGGGALILLAGLWAGRLALNGFTRKPLHGHGWLAIVRFAFRNSSRNPTRSLLTTTLIALASFLLIAVESFRRHPDRDFFEIDGGSGGFQLIAETEVPLYERFDQGEGQGDLLDRLSVIYQRAEAADPDGPSRRERLLQAEEVLSHLEVLPFQLKGGDDASCLNLYQAQQPRILGVPDRLLERGGFRFAQTAAETEDERANPWQLLVPKRPTDEIPIFVEQNTAMWMLKTGLGGVIETEDGEGETVKLRIVGLLQDSVFQSELLMSDASFRRLYPREEGYRVFLLDVSKGSLEYVAGLLETGLRSNGITVSSTRDRVAAYQQVIGTYLTTFQLLGGFGLLLGILGLGAVILRAVWERTGELALLRAVGYRTRTLESMVLYENLLLLGFGLLVGIVSAVLSVLPNLALGGSIELPRLALLVGSVFVLGLVVTVLATRQVAKTPLVPALRKE